MPGGFVNTDDLRDFRANYIACSNVKREVANKLIVPLRHFSPASFLVMLNAYPLTAAKEKLVLQAGHPRIITGIMVEHLMRCARKIGVPPVFISDLAEYKKVGKGAVDRVQLAKKTRLLAVATAGMIRERERKYAALVHWERELNLDS